MINKNIILIVDDNIEYLKSLNDVLRRDFSIITATSSKEAKEILLSRPDLAIFDIRLDDANPDNREGIDLLRFVNQKMPTIPVVMMTAYSDIDIAVEAMKIGATDFIQKTKTDIRELKKVISNAIEKSRLERNEPVLKEEIHRLESWEIIGNCPQILEIKKTIGAVAKDGQTTVLICGETGTGKELVARAIHENGIRQKEPFIPLAISALNPSILESELFGHEKGSFTGADSRKIGYIERANGGILFLDEIGELSQDIQIKLIRFLDNKIFSRIGSTDLIKVDIQLLTATNKNLERAVKDGYFRVDLYHRLKTVQVFLPTLAERTEDIPILAEHFLCFFRAQGRTKIDKISDYTMELLRQYNWPGNVRELKNSIERAIIFAERSGHNQIMNDDLPYEIQSHYYSNTKYGISDLPESGVDITQELARIELAYIDKALKIVDGRKTEAWKLLNYKDRFAMRRRIGIISSKFAHLLDEFPYIKDKYNKTT